MIKEVYLFIGILAGVTSGLNFGNYYNRRVDTYEVKLLRGAADYFQNYKGNNPKEALDYAQRTLKIAEQTNFQPEKVSELEREVSIAIEQVGESSTIYKPVLNDIGKKFEDASIVKKKKTTDLVAAISGAVGCILLLTKVINSG